MRRFEYQDEKSSKFWEIEVKGTELHLRWGKIGTAGQSKVKSLEDEEKALKESDKQIKSKTKKGYLEVASGSVAPTTPVQTQASQEEPKVLKKANEPRVEEPEPATELPSENEVKLPKSWLKKVLPLPGQKLSKLKQVKPQKAIELIKKSLETFSLPPRDRNWDEAKKALANQALTPTTSYPLFWATSVASSAEARRALVDWHIAELGLTETVHCALQAAHRFTSEKQYMDWRWDADVFSRLREHVHRAEEATRQEAMEIAAAYRQGEPTTVAKVLFLFPERQDWMVEDFPLFARFRKNWLLGSVIDDEVAELIVSSVNLYDFRLSDRNILPTFVTSLGAAGGEYLVQIVPDYLDAEDSKLIAFALGSVPSVATLAKLLELEGKNKHIRAGLSHFFQSFPRLGLSYLCGARQGKNWVRSIVRETPQVLEATKSELTAEQLLYLEECLSNAESAPEADPKDIPDFLKNPPWLERVERKAVNIALEELEHEPSMAWCDGEKSKWTSARMPADDFEQDMEDFYQDKPVWYRNQRFPQQIVEAPLEAARKILGEWTPNDFWYYGDYLKAIVARFELEALPKVRSISTKEAIAFCAPFNDKELCLKAADFYCRLKSVRKPALDYLCRYPDTAAKALVPRALGKNKKERDMAEKALFAVSQAVGEDKIREQASRYGEKAAEAIDSLLGRDPLTVLPKKMPRLPHWFDAGTLPAPVLKGGKGALSLDACKNFTLMLALSKIDEVYPGVTMTVELCEPESLVNFAWELFSSWLECGADSKENWAFTALAILGNDETARKLTPYLKRWPGEGGHARAVIGLDILREIGTDVALMHLYGLSQKLKFKGLKNKAGEKVEEIAEDRNLSSEELGDRLVPDLGLNQDGGLELDYGTRQFKVGFDEQLKPFVYDSDKKRLKNLPKPGKRDEAEKAEPAEKLFKALKKDVRTVAKQQIHRLELAMCAQRRWSLADFQHFFVDHPLLIHLVRRIVWARYEAGKFMTAFRVAEDRSFADLEDEEFKAAPDCIVGIPHPLEIGEEALAAWRELFADYELLQPFSQLHREAYTSTESERKSKEWLEHKDTEVDAFRVMGLESKGWRRGEAQDGGVICWMSKALTRDKVVYLNLDPGMVVGEPGYFPSLKLGSAVLMSDESAWYPKPNHSFGEISEVEFSELKRDLAGITG